MFFSYVVQDTVEIEPVYFPVALNKNTTTQEHATSAVGTSNSEAGRRNSRSNNNNKNSNHRNSNHGGSYDSQSYSHLLKHLESQAPYEFALGDVVEHRLTERYVGKVIPEKGFCVAISAIHEFTDSEIKGFAGSAWLKATFEVCVFAPQPGTRMRAKILYQGERGAWLTVDFFPAASFPFFVPAAQMVPGSRYDEEKHSWYIPIEEEEGKENGEEGGGRAALLQRNYYVVGEDVVAKVDACIVRSELDLKEAMEAAAVVAASSAAVGVSAGAGLHSISGGSSIGGDVGNGTATATAPPLMEILGSFNGDALGPVLWFES